MLVNVYNDLEINYEECLCKRSISRSNLYERSKIIL